MRNRILRSLLATQLAVVVMAISLAATRPAMAHEMVGPDADLHRQLVEKSIKYLKNRGQADDGSYSAGAGPGITALVTTAVLRSGRSPSDPMVAKSLKYLKGFVRSDGGVYAENSLYRNYETCMAIMCFVEANKRGEYDTLLKNANTFLKGLQLEEGGTDPSNPAYGGTGYGNRGRPDGSNLIFTVEALRKSGSGTDDPAIQRALIFLGRMQVLEGPHNDTKHSRNKDPKDYEINKGGFIYTPAGQGESQAKWDPDASDEVNAQLNRSRGLRAYGPMTYGGLKSMIYAGLKSDDVRVVAAKDWIGRNYTLKKNPGLNKNGLFYYYHTFAKTMHVVGDDYLTDAEDKKHDWRRELTEQLAKHQNEDGSWINETTRWLEGDPNLVTGYALLSLSYCAPKKATTEKTAEK